MSLPEIWAGFSWLITSTVALIAIISSIWISVGRPIKKRLDDDRKERLEVAAEELRIRTEREASVDVALEGFKADLGEIKTTQVQLRDAHSLTVDQYNVVISMIEKANDRTDTLESRVDHFQGVIEGLTAALTAIAHTNNKGTVHE